MDDIECQPRSPPGENIEVELNDISADVDNDPQDTILPCVGDHTNFIHMPEYAMELEIAEDRPPAEHTAEVEGAGSAGYPGMNTGPDRSSESDRENPDEDCQQNSSGEGKDAESVDPYRSKA